jgi:hypothetical protein
MIRCRGRGPRRLIVQCSRHLIVMDCIKFTFWPFLCLFAVYLVSNGPSGIPGTLNEVLFWLIYNLAIRKTILISLHRTPQINCSKAWNDPQAMAKKMVGDAEETMQPFRVDHFLITPPIQAGSKLLMDYIPRAQCVKLFARFVYCGMHFRLTL